MEQEKIKKQKRIWIVLTVLWMVVIFVMSARNADLSGNDSSFVCMLLLRVFYPGFRSLPAAAQAALLASLQLPVRKAAHMTEYAILGIFLLKDWQLRDAGKYKKIPGIRICLAALCSAALYAVTDEIHQYFTAGRSCELRDVAIDTAGAAIGIIFLRLFIELRTRKR